MPEYTSPRGRELPGSTYAVLGLIDESPSSGYDLASFADQALGYFWPVSRTLAYRELGRLENLGWLEATQIAQQRYPDKRVWSVTAKGREALTAWLSKPAEGMNSFRSGFLLKFMFGIRMRAADMTSLLEDYRESLETTVVDLTSIMDRLADRPEARMGRLAALHGLRSAQARLAWVDEVEQDLRENPLSAEREGAESGAW